jgi:dolichyl-phosphate-mannose-protein mannosyltransferase
VIELSPTPGSKRDRQIALVLTLIAAAFRLPRLGFPAEEIFDEVYHAKTALQYLQGENPVEWVHPPTAKLLIAIGVWLFGYKPWAWRLLPALAGIALAPVFYSFARRALATERAAVLATVLLLADGVYLVQSRVAMTNIFAVLFQVTAALFVLRAVLKDPLPVKEMLAGGLFLALALSTRWTSLWAWGFLGILMLVVRASWP